MYVFCSSILETEWLENSCRRILEVLKYMSHAMRKRVFERVFEQARYKPACAATEAS